MVLLSAGLARYRLAVVPARVGISSWAAVAVLGPSTGCTSGTHRQKIGTGEQVFGRRSKRLKLMTGHAARPATKEYEHGQASDNGSRTGRAGNPGSG
jgi:hypothetical protein